MPEADNINLRRLACVAQGGHVFANQRRADHLDQAYCEYCGVSLRALWEATDAPAGARCFVCEPYSYADSGARFGRQT